MARRLNQPKIELTNVKRYDSLITHLDLCKHDSSSLDSDYIHREVKQLKKIFCSCLDDVQAKNYEIDRLGNELESANITNIKISKKFSSVVSDYKELNGMYDKEHKDYDKLLERIDDLAQKYDDLYHEHINSSSISKS